METRTVHVPAIGCNGCIRTIQSEVSQVPGVTAVKAVLPTKLVTVSWDDRTTWQTIRAKLDEIGYAPEES